MCCAFYWTLGGATDPIISRQWSFELHCHLAVKLHKDINHFSGITHLYWIPSQQPTYVFVSTEPKMYVRLNDLQILFKCFRQLDYSSAVTIRTGGSRPF